jgi:hypothetical protein
MGFELDLLILDLARKGRKGQTLKLICLQHQRRRKKSFFKLTPGVILGPDDVHLLADAGHVDAQMDR